MLRSDDFVADEVIESELVTGLESEPIPLQSAAERPLDVDTMELFCCQPVIFLGVITLRFEPSLRLAAQVLFDEVRLCESEAQLRTGEEDHIQFFPKGDRVIAADGDGDVGFEYAMAEVFDLCGRSVKGTPVLGTDAVSDIDQQAGLEAEMNRQYKIESSAYSSAMEEHVGVREVRGALVVLGIPDFEAVVHMELIVTGVLRFASGVEELIIDGLEVGLLRRLCENTYARTRENI